MPLRYLLVQARHPDDPMLEHERRSFAAHLGAEIEQIEALNLIERPAAESDLRRCDALLVGGSGEYYISKRHLPNEESFFALLVAAAQRGHPTFASCFGFQAMARALGGEVVHHPESTEVGTHELRLTEAGRQDPLLGQLPERFAAQLGRKDRVDVMPPGVPNLVTGDANRHQALRIPGQPVWATQFHPELTGSENRTRFERYLEGYAGAMSAEKRAEALAGFGPSPEANTLLERFVRLVFG